LFFYCIDHVLQAADVASTSRLVKAAVQHCYDARNYTLLNSTVTILSKKHGQLKAAVQAIVELTMSWLTEVRARDGVEKWLELVETLRGVTEGKVCNTYSSSIFHY
jgi:26S proteasome regulatory subunit N5